MVEFYFDIETGDLDPWTNQVIALAYQPIRGYTPNGSIIILKGWEKGGEKRLLEQILDLGVFETNFDFIPVGTNLAFDFTFLIVRMQRLGVKTWTPEDILRFFREKPVKDIKSSLVMMNDGDFRGSGLDVFTRKKRTTGSAIVELWARKDLESIVQYIKDDASAFFDVYKKVGASLGELGKKMRVKSGPHL